MDAIRKQLDVLMGANRNGDVTEVNRKYHDRDVCRLFLCGLCPHDLFQLTKMDMGPCPKIHSLQLRKEYPLCLQNNDVFTLDSDNFAYHFYYIMQFFDSSSTAAKVQDAFSSSTSLSYEEGKAKGEHNYDRELEDMIERLIVECERKIQRALKRLEDEDATAAVAISVSKVTQTPEVMELSKQIKEKLKEADAFGLLKSSQGVRLGGLGRLRHSSALLRGGTHLANEGELVSAPRSLPASVAGGVETKRCMDARSSARGGLHDFEGKTDSKIRVMELVEELKAQRADKQSVLLLDAFNVDRASLSLPNPNPSQLPSLPVVNPPDPRTQEMINEKLKKAEDLGERGMIDEAQKALEEAEAMKKLGVRQEPVQEPSKYSAADVRITDQKLRVCDICGAFLSVYDNDRRLADHFGGKLHLGYIQIREKLAELQFVLLLIIFEVQTLKILIRLDLGGDHRNSEGWSYMGIKITYGGIPHEQTAIPKSKAEERNKKRKVDRTEDDRRSKERSRDHKRSGSKDRDVERDTRVDNRDRGREYDRRSRDQDRHDRDRRDRDRESDQSRSYNSRSRRSRSRSKDRTRDYDRHRSSCVMEGTECSIEEPRFCYGLLRIWMSLCCNGDTISCSRCIDQWSDIKILNVTD
ncbi:hypothetical protein ZIOFF_016332 [Zingiber officinale]|uniref:LUC7 related protein n=1 Tax=Zingiber officinale TaxID=94328 RepID=A0A8J5LV60_ZINOF|nr:hypothetical protein ZIOFF_016332 [Zingiber officinale]